MLRVSFLLTLTWFELSTFLVLLSFALIPLLDWPIKSYDSRIDEGRFGALLALSVCVWTAYRLPSDVAVCGTDRECWGNREIRKGVV